MDLDTTDVAKLIKKDLRAKFPGCKFSVRSDKYSMGSSIDIRWTDGPSEGDVKALVDRYESKGFDGMIDLAYSYWHWRAPDGTISLGGTCGTEGSGGVVPAFENPKPHPDAVRVSLYTGYVHYYRELSEAYIAKFREAFAELSEHERFVLIDRTNALRALWRAPNSYHLDAELADFPPEDAATLFRVMAQRVGMAAIS